MGLWRLQIQININYFDFRFWTLDGVDTQSSPHDFHTLDNWVNKLLFNIFTK